MSKQPTDWRTASTAAQHLAKRSRQARLLRLVVYGTVLVAIAVVAALIITGRTVVPYVSEMVYPIHYRAEIAGAADTYEVNPFLVAAIVKTESGYNPEAVSEDGAVGLMQLMPETAEWVSGLRAWEGRNRYDLTEPEDNVALGACYLAYLFDEFDGESLPGIAAYNAGQGAVQSWIDAAGGPQAFDLGDIGYTETREFVERVQRYWDLYSRISPDAFTGIEE